MSFKEAKQYIIENQFAAGSMLPKVQAALNFIENKSKREAVIANLENVQTAIENKNGTKFIN